MQPQQQSSRIDLVELKAQIVKKIGVERSKKYFYILQRFLFSKLSKSELDKSCFRLLGRENIPLHNQLIRSILKNACLAKTLSLPVHKAGHVKPAIQVAKKLHSKDDELENGGFVLLNQNQNQNQNQNASIWPNGVLPVSPRKVRSVVRERKVRDRHNPLHLNGLVECHQHAGREDSGSKIVVENGELPLCDYQRPGCQLQEVAKQPENEREGFIQLSVQKQGPHSRDQTAVVKDGEEVEQAEDLGLRRGSLVAPLGIPFCSASVGGARKAVPVAAGGDFVSYYDHGGLFDSETLRRRMEQIAAAQGLGGVTVECANMLNKVLDVYLKRLIKSCVELVGARSSQDLRRHHIKMQQAQGKFINGMWPSNHLHVQSSGSPAEVMQEWRPRSISLLDFKVAMELNPQQLGEDWPLLLEKICVQAFDA